MNAENYLVILEINGHSDGKYIQLEEMTKHNFLQTTMVLQPWIAKRHMNAWIGDKRGKFDKNDARNEKN